MKKVKEYRFTVFTQDARIDTISEVVNGINVTKKTKFTWKLNFGQFGIQNAKLGIESILARDTSLIVDNTKEIYTIRCPSISSQYFYDTRDNTYPNCPIIYMGELNFKNTNPTQTFCYDTHKDILNTDFTLFIDNNKVSQGNNLHGIAETLHIGITFILYDISDD